MCLGSRLSVFPPMTHDVVFNFAEAKFKKTKKKCTLISAANSTFGKTSLKVYLQTGLCGRGF